MHALYLVLFIIAAVCFAIAAFANPSRQPRINLVAAGLLAWVLVPLIQSLVSLD